MIGKTIQLIGFRSDVAEISEKVPHRKRRKERDHQIRPRLHAIEAQGLPEILFRRDQVDLFRHIDQPRKPEGAVQQKPSDFSACAFDLSLETDCSRTAEEIENCRTHC